MGFVHEIQIISTGYPGAPGYTNLYFLADITMDYSDQFTAAKAFLGEIAGVSPTQWSGQINPVGRVLEETTGALAQFSTAPSTAQPAVNGVYGGAFGAGVAGVVLGWSTATVNRARLVRGRTFIVPAAAPIFEGNGTIIADVVNGLTSGGQDLIDAAVGFCVWSRPRAGTGGLGCEVVSVRVNDRAAFLTSRRS